MRWYLLGLVTVMGVAAAAFDLYYYRTTAAAPAWGFDPEATSAALWTHALSIGVVPVIGGIVGALLLHAARPMRLFSCLGKRRVAKVALGAVSSLIACGLILLALPPAADRVPDVVVTALCGAIAAVGVLLVSCAKERLGCCVACGYDLKGSRMSGKCPECGLACGPGASPSG